MLRLLCTKPPLPSRYGRRFWGRFSQNSTLAADEFELVAAATALIRDREKDGPPEFAAWKAISDCGAELLSSTGSPQILVWVLDALSEADLHPDERKQLVFLPAYRERINEAEDLLSQFSNDELCVCWRAFDRLQLLDRAILLKFLDSTTRPLATVRCHGSHAAAPPRYSSFTLWNWVVQAQGFRNMKQYPDSVVIAKSIAKRLMVEEEHSLRAQGLTFSAMQAVVNMVPLSSRQRHRMVAQLSSALQGLSLAELAELPRLAARGQLLDEDFFMQVAERLGEAMPNFRARELYVALRNLLSWRVGAPGLDRSGLAAFEAYAKWDEQTPDTALRVLRALGRIDASTMDRPPDSTEPCEGEIALGSALRGSLKALNSTGVAKTFTSRDVLFALNALGQIARAWNWLGTTENLDEAIFRCTLMLCDLAHLQLDLLDAQRFAGGGSDDGFTTRDLALMLLALGRLARRRRSASLAAHLPGFAEVLCQRLQLAAEHWESVEKLKDEDLRRLTAEATASLSAASLMLMHCAKDAEMHGRTHRTEENQTIHSPSVPLAVIMAWTKAALNLGIDVGQDSFKALAATTTMVMQQLTEHPTFDSAELKESKDRLQWLLEFATRAVEGNFQVDMSQMDNWHLDSCLHALAVLDTLNQMMEIPESVKDRSRVMYIETAVLVEATSDTRLPKLQENNVAFWLRLLNPRLSHQVATKLAFQLHESARCQSNQSGRKKIPPAVRAALRDFLFSVQHVRETRSFHAANSPKGGETF